MKKIYIQTRENRNNRWWCNTTVNCMDISFEGKTIEDAQGQMMEFIHKSMNCEFEIVWEKLEFYPNEKPSPKTGIFYQKVRIDYNPQG